MTASPTHTLLPANDKITPSRSAIPSATYRLQLHRDFTLDDATTRVGYFARLGVSHLYLSPVQVAREGSSHGYDVIDHRAINPELGGEAALRRLSEACRTAGMGLIVDIVPNHMAVGGADNPMWLDVIENGAESKYARVFDIDFRSTDPSLDGKVVLPVLGEPYGEVLNDGKLSLVWDTTISKLAFAYGPNRFPLRPQDYTQITRLKDPSTVDLAAWQDPKVLHDLLEKQNFRLTWWNAAGDIINWRRFFDVNELAGIRMEDDYVFDLTHEIIVRLYSEGIVDGVRVDHVDGLADPAGYLKRLRQALLARNPSRSPHSPIDGPYIVVEKILGLEETLPLDWGVHGTTGYDFMDQVNALQHDPKGQPTLDEIWVEISGRDDSFDAEETASRTEVLHGGFAGQLANSASALAELAQTNLATRDLTAESFRRVLVAFISRLRRYRSYATGVAKPPKADPSVQLSLAAAKESLPADAASFEFVESVLIGDTTLPALDSFAAVRRLNQLTAPVAAKAVEDTAFYRYSRLLSRNDVGFQVSCFSKSSRAFLKSGKDRVSDCSYSMLTTATHDHKRGEDVRARLAVISEVPGMWGDVVQALLLKTREASGEVIAGDDHYALFQTMVGTWPLGLQIEDHAGMKEYSNRIVDWRIKSLREAKLRSSWAAPDAEYEAANSNWIKRLLDPQQSTPALGLLKAFIDRISPAGAINGVVQTCLRCTWPGIPDLYQGCELWDFSLVDPDNRHPVNYAFRESLLDTDSANWASGAIKQSIIARVLQSRRRTPSLFTVGALDELPIRGIRADHVLAFTRYADHHSAVIAVMLRVAEAVYQLGDLPSKTWWADTAVRIGNDWHPAASLFQHRPVYFSLASSPE